MFHRNKPRHGKGQSARSGSSQPRAVSPNYRVDLMHHTFNQQPGEHGYAQRQGNGYSQGQGQGQQQGQGRPQGHGGPRPQGQGGQRPQGQGQGQGQSQGRPGKHFQNPRHRKPFQQHQQHGPQPKPGYGRFTVEVKDDLLAAFRDKIKAEGKGEKEVIGQLISFYNMGKIQV